MYTQDVQGSSDRNWDWLSAVLLILLIQVAAARLVTTDWTPLLYYSESLAALGTVLGLAMGASRLGRRAVIALTIGYSAILLPWQISGAVPDKLLLDRLLHTGRILLAALNQFLQRQPVKDPLFFVTFVSFTFWFMALAAGYRLARHGSVLTALIPSGIAILIIQGYADYQPHSSWWLALYILIALLLVGRGYYRREQKDWSRRRVFVNEEAWPNILGGLFTTVTVAIIIAWLIPTSFSSLHTATDTWNNFIRPLRERLSNAVTSLNGPYGRPGSNFYGSTLALGRSAASGDSSVFIVEVRDAPDFSVRYYWRGRVYDDYRNGRWSSSPGTDLSFQPADGDLKIPDLGARSQALLRFTSQFPTQSLLYAPSQPVWVDRPGTILTALTDSGLHDILAWESRPAIQRGGRYQVRAEIANPNIQQLRSADRTYPSWIKDRYLELPATIRPDIRALAEKVTAGQDNPYDKAAAITNYLRANIKYSTSVPAPPEGQDPIEWVLFNYRMGFCNYYASAEVLMLRSVGIPARLAVGFAQGQHQNNTYVVRIRDAHAWPEVYFPAIGWVEFEPTVSQDPLVRPNAEAQAGGIPFNRPPARPLDEEEQAAPDNSESPAAAKSVPFAQTLLGRALVISASLLAAALLIFLGYRYRVLSYVPLYLAKTYESSSMAPPLWIEYWLRWNRLQPVEQSFASINWGLHWLGKPPSMDATPAERAALLKKLLPAAAEHISVLTSELESALFTPRPADMPRARRASFFIVLHALRARARNLLGALDGRDVYSR